MKMFFVLLMACVGLGVLSAPIQARTIAVPSEYGTIGAAIKAASSGDEIVVSSGTYYENLDIRKKSFFVRFPERRIRSFMVEKRILLFSLLILTVQMVKPLSSQGLQSPEGKVLREEGEGSLCMKLM